MTEKFPGLKLQVDPPILVALIPGNWLLKRTTPSWRIKDPTEGFQRRVDEDRAKQIAVTVLDAGRTFPNAIVLATNLQKVECTESTVAFPPDIKLLVVDGQHRLWAQKFSKNIAKYCCLVHLGLTEKEMAQLFVEINDNQKRVPSSLRWDLVRLVRKEDDPYGVRAVDLIYDLNNENRSPLFQRIDLTGEQYEISLKQGSLAPEVRSLVSKRGRGLYDLPYGTQIKILSGFISAVRELDPDGWDNTSGPVYKARVIIALLRLMPDISDREAATNNRDMADMNARIFLKYLQKIDLKTLAPEKIRGQQGSAGMRAIYLTLRRQVLGR